MFGEQGLVDKRAAYEASIRVPMIVHAPERLEARTVNPVMARNIDIAPTILTLAGLAIPDHYEGRDILSVDPETDDEPLIYEYYWEFNYPQTPSTFAVRTVRYKYIQYHGVWDTEELFDLQADPEERINLVNDPDHQDALIALRAQLFAAISIGDDRPDIPFTERFNQGAVFWSDSVSSSVSFPPHWERDSDAPDKYEHVLPDGPGKSQQLQAITPAIRQIIDGEAGGDKE
jgi:arylsulfatase A-like enzyme